MARTKGSKNTHTKEDYEKLKKELQSRVDELEKQYNSYQDVVSNFVDGFILDLEDKITTIDLKTLQEWFSNPDTYMDKITGLLTYYYITDGNMTQLYDFIFSLPELNYKITCYDRLDSYEEDVINIKKALDMTVNHKLLTRQLLVQLAHQGSVLGTWLGNKREPYFHIFDNLDYIYPYGLYKGKMVGVFDLTYIDTLNEEQKEALYTELSPFITQRVYDKWKNCNDDKKKKELQLVVLPPEKSLVARIKILGANQRLGIPQGTQAIYDIKHKQKMKDLERAIADKIIRAIAVVKFKGVDSKDHTIKESVQKKVFNNVRKALQKNNSSDKGLTVIGLPEWAEFDYPDIKGSDALDSEKYDSINNDILSGIGISSVLINGSGGNYSSANLNLDMLYRKIGTMLEQIEDIYNQLIVITLGKTKGKNYRFEYDKQSPLSKSDKLKTLQSLADKGYAIRPLLEMINVDFEDYIKESIYEIDVLKLRDKITPPLSTYTATENGKSQSDDKNVEDSTLESRERDGNNLPSPSDN